MRSKTKKSISRLVGIWTFLLLLIFKGICSKPAYAFLSSLDACAANPECAAIVGSELSPAVATPTAEGIGTTISTTTATEASTTVEAAADVTVVGDRRLSGVAAFYIWNQAQNQQAQNLAQQKYCSANPGDSVCNNYNTVVVHAFTQYYPNQPSDYSTPSCSVIGPVSSTNWNGVHLYVFGGNGAVEVIDTVDWNPWTSATIKSVASCVSAWKDWPPEKRDAAVKLLNDSDWQGLITSMPEGGTLNPGDTINAPTIVIPGTDGTKTQSGPYTIPDSYPNAVPSPSPDPSPSPSPDPSPSPSPDPSPDLSPSPSAPTASGGAPSPSPDPSPSPSPDPSPNPSPSPSAPTASGGAPSPSPDPSDQSTNPSDSNPPQDTSQEPKPPVLDQIPETAGAKTLAEAKAAELRDTLPKRSIPSATAAVVDTKTGKVYYGTSGNPLPTTIDEYLKERTPSPSLEPWQVANCAEFKAVNNALLDGANIEDLEVHTVRTRTGEAFPRCKNCRITTDGTNVTSDP